MENGVRVGSILLQKNGSKIETSLLNIATGIQVDTNGYIEQCVTIDGQFIRFKVWKSTKMEVFGSISGPACIAHIMYENHTTTLCFVLAEKSTQGHNSADLRVPLF